MLSAIHTSLRFTSSRRSSLKIPLHSVSVLYLILRNKIRLIWVKYSISSPSQSWILVLSLEYQYWFFSRTSNIAYKYVVRKIVFQALGSKELLRHSSVPIHKLSSDSETSNLRLFHHDIDSEHELYIIQ